MDPSRVRDELPVLARWLASRSSRPRYLPTRRRTPMAIRYPRCTEREHGVQLHNEDPRLARDARRYAQDSDRSHCTDGAFDGVCFIVSVSARCLCRFDCHRSGPDAARAGTPGADSNAGGGPASSAHSDSVDILANVHCLPGRLRYAGHELPECLRHSWTTGDDYESSWYCTIWHCISWHCILHSQLHHPTTCLQAGVQ